MVTHEDPRLQALRRRAGHDREDALIHEMREQASAYKKLLDERDGMIERLHGKLDMRREDSRLYRARIEVALMLLRECSVSPMTTGLVIETLEGKRE